MTKKQKDMADMADKLAKGLGKGVPVVPVKPQEKKPAAKKPKQPTTVEEMKGVAGVKLESVDNEIKTPPAAAEAVPEPTPTPTPTPTPEAPKRLSALEQIRQASKKMGVGNLLASIEEAGEVKSDPEAIKAFLEMIATADTFVDQVVDDPQVQRDWYYMGLREIEGKLESWAGFGYGDTLNPLLAVLASFKTMRVDVSASLWWLVTEVLRPARRAMSYYDISSFMGPLERAGRVDVIPVGRLKGGEKDRAVIVNWKQEVGLLPAATSGTPDPLIVAVWPWVKEAEVRAKQSLQVRIDRLNALEKRADPNLAKGKDGKVFLRVSDAQGALVLVRTNGAGTSVKVIEVVGLPRHMANSAWIRWDAEQKFWPQGTEDIYRAFIAWKKS